MNKNADIKLSLLLLFVISFITISSCKKKKIRETSNEIRTDVQSGIWRITKFIDSGEDDLDHFSGFNFVFGENEKLTATNGTVTYVGTWSVEEDRSNDDDVTELDFVIHFNLSNDFEDLNDDWDIISHSKTTLELRDISGGNGGTDYLTFQRI